jgi:hypothetical protein
MREIGGMIATLPIGHHLQHPLRVNRAGRQYADPEELDLRQGQARGVFFSRRRTRTRKQCAKMQSVI